MRRFQVTDLQTFTSVLRDCCEAESVQGGTLASYLPRLTVGGPARHSRYGMRPIVQVYLDGKPLCRSWMHMTMADLTALA